jgi:DNA-binding GntR family transcriptional regulator
MRIKSQTDGLTFQFHELSRSWCAGAALITMRVTDPVVRKPQVKSPVAGSLSDRAHQLILDQILRGTLPLGTVISRRDLAEQFGMSLLPVNVALQRLERDGLLESQARVGTRVKIPTVTEAKGRLQLREALECQSARLCAEHCTFEERLDLKRLATNLDTLFSRAGSEDSNREFLFVVQKNHFDLHMKIADYARCEALRSAIANNHIMVFNWLYDTATARNSLPDSFHRTLVDAIITGDPQTAESEMRAHVRFGLDNLVRVIESIANNRWRGKPRKSDRQQQVALEASTAS